MDLFGSGHPDAPSGAPTATEPGPHSPPPARAPLAGRHLDGWAGDGHEGASGAGRSRRWLLVAAVVPWLVVVALLVAHAPQGAPSTSTPAPATGTDDAVVPTTGPTAPPPSSVPLDEPAPPPGGSRPPSAVTTSATTGAATRGRAVGIAIMAARAWLSTHPTGATVDGLDTDPLAGQQYVEHLAVETIDHPARGAVVVTCAAIVLPVQEDRYGPPELVRVAVPVRMEADRVRLAGAPWRLEQQQLGVEAVEGTPVEDPDLRLAATEAVQRAGYRNVSLTGLVRTDGWPFVARVEARAPGHTEPRRHVLWLRADVGRLVVAGAPAPPGGTTATPTPVPTPAEEAS